MRYLISLLAAAAFVLTACSSGGAGKGASTPPASSSAPESSTPSTITLSGHVTLLGAISTGVDAMTQGAPCEGITNPSLESENFEDIAEGTQVEVHDGTGATVAVGNLSGGLLDVVNPLDERSCVFDYTVSGIPAGRGIYQIFVGSHASQKIAEANLSASSDLTLQSALYSG